MKKTLIGFAVAAALGMSASAHAYDVDLFTVYQKVEDISASAVAGSGEFSSVPDNINDTFIGANRDAYVQEVTSEAAAPDADTASTLVISGGELSFSNDSGVTGYAVVQWDGVDATAALDADGLGGINLLQYGGGVAVTVIKNDLPFVISVGAFTDATHFTVVQIQTVANAVPVEEFISFEDLMNPLLCGQSFGQILSVTCGGANNQTVNMASLGAIEFIINDTFGGERTVDVDLRLGPLTVPEPGTLSLLGLGLLGASLPGLRRRRLSKTAA